MGGGKIGFYWPKSRLTARFEAEFVGDIAEKKVKFQIRKVYSQIYLLFISRELSQIK